MGVINNGRSYYDPDLQMFTNPPGNPDPRRLRFLRWLAERGRLEHRVAGIESGPLAGLANRRETVRVGGGGNEDDMPGQPRGEFMTRRMSVEDLRRRV